MLTVGVRQLIVSGSRPTTHPPTPPPQIPQFQEITYCRGARNCLYVMETIGLNKVILSDYAGAPTCQHTRLRHEGLSLVAPPDDAVSELLALLRTSDSVAGGETDPSLCAHPLAWRGMMPLMMIIVILYVLVGADHEA